MSFCGNCGAQMEDGTKFCTSCGNPMEQKTMNQQQQQYQQQQQSSQQQQFNQQQYYQQSNTYQQNYTGTSNIFDTADHTASYNPMDIEQNKVMAVLSYIGILWLIPMFAAKQSPFARFHVKQGFLLFGCGLADGILNFLFGLISVFVPGIWIITTLLNLINVVIFVFAILGIINAAQGKAKELPLIGKAAMKFNFLN